MVGLGIMGVEFAVQVGQSNDKIEVYAIWN